MTRTPKVSTQPVIPAVDAKALTGDALVQDIIEKMEMAGACIVRNMYDKAVIDEVVQDITPHLKEQAEYQSLPTETTYVTGLLSKSKAYALNMVGDLRWHKVVEHFLTSKYGPVWLSPSGEPYTYSKPQLELCMSFRIAPGAKAQALHRDDSIHHVWNTEEQSYRQGRDGLSVMFVALTKTTKENGATRVIPGSHLWDYLVPPPNDESAAVAAELNPGDSLLTLGSVIHAGGANTTRNEFRLLAAAAATRSYYRQQENQYLAHDLEKVKQLPVYIQKFMGYSLGEPWSGWVDFKDPLRLVNPECNEFMDKHLYG